MFMQQAPAKFVAAFLCALPFAVLAHSEQPEDRLVHKYARFAGSKDNAEALVNGLRNDQPVKLSSRTGSTNFTPPTQKMGYGNVDIALALSKAALAEHGIRNPTPEQVKAAMNGGTVTTKSGERVTLPGVLKLRAQGMGWGQVAQKHGFKLGEVMRHKHGNHHHHHAHWKRHHGDDDDDGKHRHKHGKHDWDDDRDHRHKHAKHHDRHDDRKHHHKHADWKHHHKHADSKHHHKPDRDHHNKHADWKHHHKPDRDHRHKHADWKHHHKPDWKHHDRGDFHRAFDRQDFGRPHKIERPEKPERHHRRD